MTLPQLPDLDLNAECDELSLDDALVRDIVLPAWLSGTDGGVPLHEKTLTALASSIDTYFAGQPFCVKIRVGIVVARVPLAQLPAR